MTGRNIALIKERADAGDLHAKAEWAEIDASGRLDDLASAMEAVLESLIAYKAALEARYAK